MISGPIVEGFYFWRRRSQFKTQIIDEKIRHKSRSNKHFFFRNKLFFAGIGLKTGNKLAINASFARKISTCARSLFNL